MFKAAIKRMLLCCAAVFCIGIVGSVNAQYVGPDQGTAVATVADVLKNASDDQYVVLRGNITKKLRRERYEFSDGTGTIRVEIDDKHFRNMRVSENTVVEIYGEMERGLMRSPKIDVKRMTIVTP